MHLLLLSLGVFVLSVPRANALSPQVASLVSAWSPLVWMHSEEVFFPSSVDYFLDGVSILDNQGVVLQPNSRPSTLAGGEPSRDWHLQTRETLACPACLGPSIFWGQRVETGAVPVYALVREYQDAHQTVDVAYHTFYPYNRGKDVCVGIRRSRRGRGGSNASGSPRNASNCIGTWGSFGNHVGDWEHASLRFQNGEPIDLYLSVHSFGAYYAWNASSFQFEFYKGETLRQKQQRLGAGPKRRRQWRRDLSPTYPPIVSVAEGTHPVAYAANGSHGLWAGPGVHTYLPFPLLQDVTEPGIPWRTWDNLKIVEWTDTPFEGELTWLNFLGRWGNTKQGCELESITGECTLGNGPSGPGAPDDLPPPFLTRMRTYPAMPGVPEYSHAGQYPAYQWYGSQPIDYPNRASAPNNKRSQPKKPRRRLRFLG